MCAKIRLLVRRFASISLLALMLTTALAPFAQAWQSSVPACCRTGGRHHCEMSMGTSGLEGFKSAREICPYRIHAAVTSQVIALTAAPLRISVLLPIQGAARPTEATLSANHSDQTHKRGPPVL